MKKMLIIFAITSLTSLSCFAAKYGSAGCGPGSMIWEGDQTMWKQVLAASTNMSVFQITAIALGTSNCDSPAPLKLSQLEAFVEANKFALANDIARGGGETVTGLSNVYGCSNKSEFNNALKDNFKSIFPTSEVSPKEITHSLNMVAADSCSTTASL
jgi:hypothetical protein